MAVHTIHIFDRKGKTLFTKRYYPNTSSSSSNSSSNENDSEQLSEQRKLVFGMVYSLREITKMLAPQQQQQALPTSTTTPMTTDTGLHSVRTGASTLHTYETNSGLRLCIYVTNQNHPTGTNHTESGSTTSDNKMLQQQQGVQVVSGKVVRAALYFIYHELWIQCVTRSPMYTPTAPNVMETNFESKLDSYLKAQSWFV